MDVLMNNGFIKIAAATPVLRVADVMHNAEQILRITGDAVRAGVHVLVFPELCLTGYTCGDLFGHDELLSAAESALLHVARETADTEMLIFVGLPLRHRSKLYNCAAALYGGRVLGIVPKSNIPNYGEFYEARKFAAAPDGVSEVMLDGKSVPFGTKLLFECPGMPDFKVACEICEDAWVASPPSIAHTGAGASVIVNLSASNETAGKAEYRRSLVRSLSASLVCAYAYADAGDGESTTDIVFSGHDMIAQNGTVTAEAEPFSGKELIVAAADLGHIAYDRRNITTRDADADDGYVHIPFDMPVRECELHPMPGTAFAGYSPDPRPFVPADAVRRDERCRLILGIQANGLASRIRAAHASALVIGISGGLDSCLALIVACLAADKTGLDRKSVYAVTMPCFGTSGRTRRNAEELCRLLGVGFECIEIADAVNLHFRDIGHDPEVRNVVYENSQARERTQILFDLANARSALLVGTGDLSELALGFATYNGDHMSSYGVNAGVPKTLVRYLVRYYAEKSEREGSPELAAVLLDILATPVSPELLPADENGEIAQETESLVGPYELHDFYLYHTLRYGERPSKIYRMARLAFDGEFSDDEIKKWMRVFFRRFFTQQFKRSCLPDGPKVGSAALSPRGDWRMPSDASAALWLDEIESL